MRGHLLQASSIEHHNVTMWLRNCLTSHLWQARHTFGDCFRSTNMPNDMLQSGGVGRSIEYRRVARCGASALARYDAPFSTDLVPVARLLGHRDSPGRSPRSLLSVRAMSIRVVGNNHSELISVRPTTPDRDSLGFVGLTIYKSTW